MQLICSKCTHHQAIMYTLTNVLTKCQKVIKVVLSALSVRFDSGHNLKTQDNVVWSKVVVSLRPYQSLSQVTAHFQCFIQSLLSIYRQNQKLEKQVYLAPLTRKRNRPWKLAGNREKRWQWEDSDKSLKIVMELIKTLSRQIKTVNSTS